MLCSMPVVTFVPCTKPELARPFYEGVLGLRFVGEDQFAVVFSADGVMVRVVNVAGVPGHTPAQFTILGWMVPDIESMVRALVSKGVEFTRYRRNGAGSTRHLDVSERGEGGVVQGSVRECAVGNRALTHETHTMVEITVENGRVHFDVQNWDKLWALRSRLEIPVEHIHGVRIDPEPAKGWWHGLKLPGTQIPGLLTAGTFYQDGDWVFYDVHEPERTIVLDLDHEHYKRLVIEVADPATAVAQLKAAGVPVGA